MTDPRSSPVPPRPQAAAVTTSTGLAPNVGGALAYLLGPITGILFLVIEKEDRFVRFHAAQSIALTVAWFALTIVLTIVSTVLGALPGVGWLIGIAFFLISLPLALAGFCLWLLLMYRAYQGKEWQLPVIGGHARRFVTQGSISG
jgi:uncharacterized membrane protein